MRAPVEQLFRAVIKSRLQDEAPPAVSRPSRCAGRRVLPPLISEMGSEIRYHLARVEPWIRNGWQVMSRHPAFYPRGTAFFDKAFFAEVEKIQIGYQVLGSRGSIYVPPLEGGGFNFKSHFDGKQGSILMQLDDVTKVTTQALAEIALRKLFLDWFHYDGRALSDYDRYVLSFDSTAPGNGEYHCAAALRPSFLPPSFEAPPEPMAPHVGVQIRHMTHLMPQPRNSNPAWMLQTAGEIGRHLGLPVLVYGHPAGCLIPEGCRTSWDPARAEDHKARELGYLKSCALMLSPDSGWADLMAWLEIPTLLEMVHHPGEYEPLRAGFRPRLQIVDRGGPIGPQVDALLASSFSLPDSGVSTPDADAAGFPWAP